MPKNVVGQADHAVPAVAVVVVDGVRAYTKLIVHVVFTLGAALFTLLDQGGDTVQWLQVLSQALVIAGVWVASNTVPGARYAKGIISGTGAALAVLLPVVAVGGDAFSGGTLLNMLLAVAGTFGVVAVPDTTRSGENVIRLAERMRAGHKVI